MFLRGGGDAELEELGGVVPAALQLLEEQYLGQIGFPDRAFPAVLKCGVVGELALGLDQGVEGVFEVGIDFEYFGGVALLDRGAASKFELAQGQPDAGDLQQPAVGDVLGGIGFDEPVEQGGHAAAREGFDEFGVVEIGLGLRGGREEAHAQRGTHHGECEGRDGRITGETAGECEVSCVGMGRLCVSEGVSRWVWRS